jgi:peptidoglycan/LPS O-acetylase OafA/YrhL
MTATPPRFAYLYSVRALAILAVIGVHTRNHQLPEPWHSWVGAMQTGVQLFFLASAITLLFSWNARNDGLINFYVRRLFRIAPLFWLAIAG